MQEGELGAADLERLFLGVVSFDDVQHEVVEIDEGFADRARLDLALSKLSPRQEQVVRLRFGSSRACRTKALQSGKWPTNSV